MFRFKEAVDRLMTVITFAEANEHKTALDILNEKPKKKIRKRTVSRSHRREDSRPTLRV
jgi:hypothetical protein